MHEALVYFHSCQTLCCCCAVTTGIFLYRPIKPKWPPEGQKVLIRRLSGQNSLKATTKKDCMSFWIKYPTESLFIDQQMIGSCPQVFFSDTETLCRLEKGTKPNN